MQVYRNSKRDSIKTFLFFAIVLFIAYLPVSSFLFFLKNDAFNGYFPPKFFMSESLHSGHLPLWNPYINFGLPQYGDMSSGFWSPVTWLVAATVRYNAYSFTIELLLYILTAGIGMYLLCRFYGMVKQVCLIAGIAYMCCGYMVGHLQHFNWISGAAFLPLCIWAYHRLQINFSFKNTLLASLIFYLMAASAHPGITIGSLYFFAAYALFIFFKQKSTGSFSKNLIPFLKKHAALLIGIGLLSLGMIAGYADILPHITRGQKVNEAAAMAHPVSLQSSLSALLPLSIVKNDGFFATDLSMRNIYFSLPLLIFFFLALFGKKNSYQHFFLFTGLAFFLLSLGGIFKMFAYNYLPLIGFVRLNGEFAIFALLSIILVAAFSLNHYVNNKLAFSGKLKIIYYLLEIFLAGCIVWGLYKINDTQDSFTYELKNISDHNGIAQQLKFLIDQISFYDALWLQGIMQMLILWGIKYCLINGQFNRLVKICILDLVLATLLNIPFTGVGKASVAEVQAVLNKSPEGIVIAPLKPVMENDTINMYESGLVGNWSFYNKQPGVKEFAFYPVELNNTKFIFEGGAHFYAGKPYLFLVTDSVSKNMTLHKFTGNSIALSLESKGNDSLVFQQNFYPHWYVKKDGRKIASIKYKEVFTAAPVTKGKNNIEFVFDPLFIKKAMLVSGLSFFCYLIILIVLFFRRPSPSSQQQ